MLGKARTVRSRHSKQKQLPSDAVRTDSKMLVKPNEFIYSTCFIIHKPFYFIILLYWSNNINELVFVISSHRKTFHLVEILT